jgi:outer membrane immunogenic protein
MWVLGVEGDVSASGVEARLNPPRCLFCRSELNWLGTARPRAGITLTPSWLLYGTGGLAVGGIHAHAGGGAVSKRETKAGWTAGFGTEAMLWRNWSIKAEYLYVDFGRFTVCTTGPRCVRPLISNYLRTHVVRAGINYHF